VASGRKVAITGMGLVTPLGYGVDPTWRAVLAGQIGVRLQPSGLEGALGRYVGRIEQVGLPADLPSAFLPQARFLNRGGLFGLAAAIEAMRHAGDFQGIPPSRRSLYLATGDHTQIGYEFLYPATSRAAAASPHPLRSETLNRLALERVNPFFLLESIHNNPFSFLTALFELTGPGTSLASQSPSGSLAVELAYHSVAAGRTDLALAVGCGSWVNDVPLHELAELGLLSRARGGARSFRPFDKRRDGFLTGEGGAALVLEPVEQARRRGAPVLGVVEGSGNRMPLSTHLSAPGHVTLGAMTAALEEAGCPVADLGLLLAHGSATRRGDRAEGDALVTLLGASHAVPVCGLKPYTGHMGAASDVAEIVLGVVAAAHRIAPGTPNFVASEPRHASLQIAATPQRCRTQRFLSASYGLLGQTSAIMVSVGSGAGTE